MSAFLLKICCIMSLHEAQLALKAGASFIGLVSEMPDGPGVITLDKIARIISALPPETKTVLLTSKTFAEDIVKEQKAVGAWGVQVVDHIDPNEMSRLKSLAPGVAIIGVVHVVDDSCLDMARSYYDKVDYLLLDSGSPDATLKSLGGTGKTHDWSLSRQVCSESPIPVLLAGGINVYNLESAIENVSPSGIDLCSGLRSDGNLDPDKVSAFMSAYQRLILSDSGKERS